VSGLANLLGKRRTEEAGHWVFRFANGLEVRTDPFMRRDRARVLPIGGPQDVLLNRLVHKPWLVRGKRVLDAFSGSGVLGLMALKLGAAHVEFVDINPRAAEFAEDNCRRNGFAAESYRVTCASVDDFAPSERANVILANPPFVMTPPGIEGTLTSRAGSEGNDLVEMLLARHDELLVPDGESYIYVLQLVVDGEPLIASRLVALIRTRTAEFTPVQEEVAPFAHYASAYLRRFPHHAESIHAWDAELRARHGENLGVQHYVLHIGPSCGRPTSWSVVDNLATEYGEGFAYAASSLADLALGRVAENFILPQY
jgi:methyltransferase family protein